MYFKKEEKECRDRNYVIEFFVTEFLLVSNFSHFLKQRENGKSLKINRGNTREYNTKLRNKPT
jgi:hypothetical protein